jgi:hypothetical protein
MRLYVTVCEEDEYAVDGDYISFSREVDWTAAPDFEEIIFVGKDEDGSEAGINAIVKRRGFSTSGITIEAVINSCREEYAVICADMLRDGFKKEYEKKALKPKA